MLPEDAVQSDIPALVLGIGGCPALLVTTEAEQQRDTGLPDVTDLAR
jgi:hypothetical protein